MRSKKPKPFTIDIAASTLTDIRERIARFPWHEAPEPGGWDYGTDLAFMRRLVGYWLDGYDWRKAETRLNEFPNFRADVDHLPIHFIHEKGSGRAPKPLLITHGWPGSVVEFLDVIEPLAHPERFGGKADDGFDVILPSIPGYGFSGKPKRPMSPREVAVCWHHLMTGILGYESYYAQGGDWGSVITATLGRSEDSCRAVHLNMMAMVRGAEPLETDDERAWATKAAVQAAAETQYLQLQASRPQTLGFALVDSPVGLAAWIIEKFQRWSDLEDGNLESVYTLDQLITNVMIYAVTKTANTALWIYRASADDRANLASLDPTVAVPAGFAIPRKDVMVWPPRSRVERVYKDIRRWIEVERGGHFLAFEQPEIFVREVRAFFTSLD